MQGVVIDVSGRPVAVPGNAIQLRVSPNNGLQRDAPQAART
jgi:hypothetical protein